MFHLLGFAAIIFIITGAFEILGVESKFYFDEVALLIVLGGTITAGIITFSFKQFTLLFTALIDIVKYNQDKMQESAIDIVKVAQKAEISKAALTDASQSNELDSFLKEGFELLISGLERVEIYDILAERIFRDRKRDEKGVHVFRGLSKYPPAFGLVGTVLGLVSLMRAVGEGAGAGEIGIQMALALVATLYGLALANFVLVPIAEHLMHKAERKKDLKELQLEGLMMIQEQKSALAVQEMMNSYLSKNERIDLIGLRNAA